MGFYLGQLGGAKPQVLQRIEAELARLRSRAYDDDPSLGWADEFRIVLSDEAADVPGVYPPLGADIFDSGPQPAQNLPKTGQQPAKTGQQTSQNLPKPTNTS